MSEYKPWGVISTSDRNANKIIFSVFENGETKEITMTLEELVSMAYNINLTIKSMQNGINHFAEHLISLSNVYKISSEKLSRVDKELSIINRQLIAYLHPGKMLEIGSAAALLDLSISRVYQLVEERKILFEKSGGKLWFKTSDLLEWLDNGRKFKFGKDSSR